MLCGLILLSCLNEAKIDPTVVPQVGLSNEMTEIEPAISDVSGKVDSTIQNFDTQSLRIMTWGLVVVAAGAALSYPVGKALWIVTPWLATPWLTRKVTKKLNGG